MRPARQTFEATGTNADFLVLLQQEVDMGADALRRGNPDIAVTLFQSERIQIVDREIAKVG
jgi:hypothetical protein